MKRTLSPKQARSAETRESLLDAAEKLLRDRAWEEISTMSIVVEAGLSNGAIYGRFKSKDEILVALYERHDEKLRERFIDGKYQNPPSADESFEEFMDREIDQLVKMHIENKWLLRAMGILSRVKPDVVSESMRTDRRQIFVEISKRFVPFMDEIEGGYQERDIEIVIFLVSTVLREALLYPGPHFDTLDMAIPELKATVKRLAVGYLNPPQNHK